MTLQLPNNLPRLLPFGRLHDYSLTGAGIGGVFMGNPPDFRFRKLMSVCLFHRSYNITKSVANASYIYVRS